MALRSGVMGINTNSWSQSGRAIVLGVIRDSMADRKPLLPSQYIFYYCHHFLYVSLVYEILTMALYNKLMSVKANSWMDAKIPWVIFGINIFTSDKDAMT